jgi:signal transduction histidine kinase
LSWLWLPLGGTLERSAIVTGMTVVLAVAAAALRDRHRARQELTIESEHAEREQARRLILEERTRIARELHDVVAHHMSLIAVQAQTAPYRLSGMPEPASAEFATISEAARAALSDMRRLLGVLRSDEAAVRAPQPQISQIPELIAAARSAGVTVTYSLQGATHTIPPSVGVCAYRVVQEGLSNASRHAPGATVTVKVQRREDAVRLEVANGPARPATPDRNAAGAGHGLAGMTERVAMLGGALTAGPVTGGGFSVTAVLPFNGIP